MNQSISNGGVCRTAPATPGLLKSLISSHQPVKEIVLRHNNSDKDDQIERTESGTTEAAEKPASAGIQFKCDLCDFESASDKRVRL